MNTHQAKLAARSWVEAQAGGWPGFRAAHFVGGITTMPDEAPFPAHKDVDLHLIFDEGSPALAGDGPFGSLIEVAHGGISIEAGMKSVAEYRSAEDVLGNPEIAHHLTLDVMVDDRCGLLRDLQPEVRREYRRRRWVRARIEHERRGQAGAFGMLPMVGDVYGASGEVNILGYTTTFATAVLQVAMLQPPKMGGRSILRLGEGLAVHDRLDLYERVLAMLGLSSVDPDRVEQVIREGDEAFGLALEVVRTPGPFRHKLQPHLRPYFVESCRAMLAEGHYREAFGWAVPYHLATADVILADAPESERPLFAFRQARLLKDLGLDTAEARGAAIDEARRVYDEIFALAEGIVAAHPDVVD